MKLLILTCLVALAIARPQVVEKTSESEEIEVPEKHLDRRYIPVKNEQQVEDHYVLPETNMMSLIYKPVTWPKEMQKFKMTNLPADKKMLVLKSVAQSEMLPPVQRKYLPLPKAKVLAQAHSQMRPVIPFSMLSLFHKQRAIPKQEMLPVSERARELLSAHEREYLSAHRREIPFALQRDMPIVAERESLPAPERIIRSKAEREILYIPKREILPVLEKEEVLPLFPEIGVQRKMEPIQYRDIDTSIVQVMPELEFYPLSQPVTNFYYPTLMDEKN